MSEIPPSSEEARIFSPHSAPIKFNNPKNACAACTGSCSKGTKTALFAPPADCSLSKRLRWVKTPNPITIQARIIIVIFFNVKSCFIFLFSTFEPWCIKNKEQIKAPKNGAI